MPKLKKSRVLFLGVIVVLLIGGSLIYLSSSSFVGEPTISFEDSAVDILSPIQPSSAKTIAIDYKNIRFVATIIEFSNSLQAENFTNYVISYGNMTQIKPTTVGNFKGYEAKLINPDPTGPLEDDAGLILSKDNLVLLFMGHTLNFQYAIYVCDWFIKNYRGL